jgi:hypothetical protein
MTQERWEPGETIGDNHHGDTQEALVFELNLKFRWVCHGRQASRTSLKTNASAASSLRFQTIRTLGMKASSSPTSSKIEPRQEITRNSPG